MITVERNVRFELGRRKELREGSKVPANPVARVPRISRLMALAIQLNKMVRDGVVADQAELN